MGDTFGARLKRQREGQHLSLAAIADKTKIKASLLEALERDDVSSWPRGIFRRAFIRSYAVALNLDPDVIVNEFLVLYPDPIDAEPAFMLASSEEAKGTSARPPTRLRYVIRGLIDALSRFGRPAQNDAPVAAVPERVLNREMKVGSPAALALAPVSNVCTELGRVESLEAATPFLHELHSLLDAVGLIVWVWDQQASVLKPVLTHGYSDELVARLPSVGRDADNATAAAFRSGRTSTVSSSVGAHGAVVVPMMAPTGCLGVLAIEMRHGREQTEDLDALVAVVAAQLARIVRISPPLEAASPESAPPPEPPDVSEYSHHAVSARR